MTKEKISGSKATITLLLQLCSFQICTIFISIVCAILNPSIFESGLLWLFLIGLIANGVILSAMLIAIFSKKLTKKLVNIFIKILKIFRIKNIDAKMKKMEEGLNKYNESAIFIKSHKSEFLKSILRVLLQTIFYYSVPFCVYKAFGLNTYNYFQIFTMQAILFTTVSSLPLPGSIGISESVFLKIFGPVFGETLLNGSMLLNRCITFYLFVIIGIMVVIFNTIKTRDIKGEIDETVLEFESIDKNIKK